MKIADLTESFEYQTSGDVADYMERVFWDKRDDYKLGRCGALAVAMARLSGKPIGALLYYEERQLHLAHAFLWWDNDVALDIGGFTDYESMAENYYLEGYETFERMFTDPHELFRINYGRGPRGRMAIDDIREAMPYAERLIELAELHDALVAQGR